MLQNPASTRGLNPAQLQTPARPELEQLPRTRPLLPQTHSVSIHRQNGSEDREFTVTPVHVELWAAAVQKERKFASVNKTVVL